LNYSPLPPRRALEAPIITLLPIDSQANVTNMAVDPEHKPNPSRHQSPPSIIASTISPVNHPSYLSVRLEKRKTPRRLNSASLDVSKTVDLTNISYKPEPPLNVETSVIKLILAATPGKPAKPKLQFILQNSKGGLDHDGPISRDVFQAYNIATSSNSHAVGLGSPMAPWLA
jgi:hypothetical protein